MVPNIAILAIDEILRHLILYSLYGRRQRGYLIETYKILNGWDHVEVIFSKKAASLDLPEDTQRRYSNREIGSILGTVSSRSGLVTN